MHWKCCEYSFMRIYSGQGGSWRIWKATGHWKRGKKTSNLKNIWQFILIITSSRYSTGKKYFRFFLYFLFGSWNYLKNITKTRVTTVQYYNRNNRWLLGWLIRFGSFQKQARQKPSNKGKIKNSKEKAEIQRQDQKNKNRNNKTLRRVNFKQNRRVARNM